MALSFNHFKSILKCNRSLEGAQAQGPLGQIKAQVQKVYSTPHFSCLGLRVPGETIIVYLGKGSGYEGLYLGKTYPDPSLRNIDYFTEYLRKSLRGGVIYDIELDQWDRSIAIHYIMGKMRNKMLFFWKAREFHVVHEIQTVQGDFDIHKFWCRQHQLESVSSSFGIFDEIGRCDLPQKENTNNPCSMDDYFQKMQNDPGTMVVKKLLQKLIKKKSRIEDDIKTVSSWREIQSYLLTVNPQEISNVFTFKNYTVKIPKGLEGYKRYDYVHNKVKALKNVHELQLKRLAEVEKEIERAETGQLVRAPVKNTLLPVIDLGRKDSVPLPVSDEPVLIFRFKEMIIGVGNNAKANDRLRTQWGSSQDMWFHLDGYKGAHIVVRNFVMDMEVVSIVGSMLRDYSKLQILTIPVIFTQLKNVKGLKGSAGTVQFKKEKRLIVDYIPLWSEKVEGKN